MIKKVWDADFNVRPWGAERDPMDCDSIFRYSVWGFCVFPHVLRKWYRFLDGRLDGNSWKVVVQKTVIDQAIFPGKNLRDSDLMGKSFIRLCFQCPSWPRSTSS